MVIVIIFTSSISDYETSKNENGDSNATRIASANERAHDLLK